LLDDDAGGIDGGVGFAEGGDDAFAAAFGWAEVNEKDLVFGVVDDGGEGGTAADEIGGGELALEYGVLEVVAEGAHGLEYLAETFVVGDVVADEIGATHENARGARIDNGRKGRARLEEKCP